MWKKHDCHLQNATHTKSVLQKKFAIFFGWLGCKILSCAPFKNAKLFKFNLTTKSFQMSVSSLSIECFNSDFFRRTPFESHPSGARKMKPIGAIFFSRGQSWVYFFLLPSGFAFGDSDFQRLLEVKLWAHKNLKFWCEFYIRVVRPE